MSRLSTRISIPAPCTQNWEQMTPTAQGRHCQACQLTVVDFSSMSDAEVVAFLAQAPATTCGRFAARQLDRPLLGAAPPPPRWRTWLAAASALTASLLTTIVARAQAPAPNAPGAQPQPVQPSRPAASPPLPTPHPVTIRGRVLELGTNNPVPFAALGFKNLGIETLSKEDGRFELEVLAAQLNAHLTDTLVVQSLGFRRSAQLIDLRSAAASPLDDLQISLIPKDIMVTTGLLIITSPNSQTKPEPKHKPRRRH